MEKKKTELMKAIDNSVWENSQFGLTYKFQNGKDLWINTNAHFNYKIEVEGDRLVLHFFPNGNRFFIELKFGELLYLRDNKQKFDLSLKNKL